MTSYTDDKEETREVTYNPADLRNEVRAPETDERLDELINEVRELKEAINNLSNALNSRK